MLGKLFNRGTASGAGPSPSAQASAKPISSLESVQEDIHTRNLLFPDAQALYQHRHDQVYPLSSSAPLPATSSTNAFDYDGDIELEPRDVRVIIMQDALSSVTASLLYDSQQPPPTPATPADRPSTMAGAPPSAAPDSSRRAGPTSPRKSSISYAQRPIIIQPDGPQSRHAGFDRRPSVQARTQAYAESDAQRAWREYREELTTFSSCIFGHSELMGYKGTSTKVHVIPSDPRLGEYGTSFGADGRGSVGRSSMRSSRLSQSFTSEGISPFSGATSSPSSRTAPDRKKVLITRLFPVNLPNDDEPVSSPAGRFSEDMGGYPFPHATDDIKPKPKKPQPKQKRTPMYAVALVISLPQVSSQPAPSTNLRAGFRGSSSYTEQESLPSSYSSTRRAGWTMAGQQGGASESLDVLFNTDTEDRMDAITQHWDIIMRTLTHLQSTTATALFTMLKQVDLASPDPYPPSISSQLSRNSSISGRRSEDGSSTKPPKTNAKHVTLMPNSLVGNLKVGAEVDSARMRIVAGLRALRVVTGQNRWGIWRDEARWVAKWAGGKEQGFFFQNLLTGFLATHTEWLIALGPPWYRKRHVDLQKHKREEDSLLPARTIIVSNDKMAARRLVFLLSAFLPASQQLPGLRPHRPSTSTSFGAFSQSPPSFVVPILKEESLRRKINRRPGPRRASHSRNVSLTGQNVRISSVPPPSIAQVAMERRHERRPSDTASIRTSDLPIPTSDPTTRKSSAATTATITPETSIPHFTRAHRRDTLAYGRPGSSGSMAADDLKRTLNREDSAGQFSNGSNESRQSSRWGSVISGFWGHRRRESTNTTLVTQESFEERSSPVSPTKGPGKKAGSTTPPRVMADVHMVESPTRAPGPVEAQSPSRSQAEAQPLTPRELMADDNDDDDQIPPEQQVHVSAAQRIPDPRGAFESPVKTSINADDGVIDVDIPFPDYLTSFETAVSSPSSSGYLSTHGFAGGLDAFEQSCRVAVDGDSPVNVAGWLQRYHPDFAIQAVPSQRDLIDEVKASLRAEPSPSLLSQVMSADVQMERWMDVSTAIIADTTDFSIRRIRYRRLVKPKPVADRTAALLGSSVSTYSSALLTPALSPFEVLLEDEFVEEHIASLDELLIDAVEKVIAMGSSETSKGTSSSSSRSTSKRRERSNSESTQSDDHQTHLAAAPAAAPPHSHHPALGTGLPHEVPRAHCKKVVLGALEDVVREVMDVREQESQDASRAAHREKESALRGAVRAWLESVEVGELI